MTLLLKLLGWAWVLLGIWWFFRPKRIRRYFEKRTHKTLRWILLTLIIAWGAAFWTAGRAIGGIGGTICAILAIVALLKGLLFLRARAAERILTWWLDQSDTFYRISAVGMIILGLAVQWILRTPAAP